MADVSYVSLLSIEPFTPLVLEDSGRECVTLMCEAAHSQCIVADDDTEQCLCLPGYRGNPYEQCTGKKQTANHKALWMTHISDRTLVLCQPRRVISDLLASVLPTVWLVTIAELSAFAEEASPVTTVKVCINVC